MKVLSLKDKEDEVGGECSTQRKLKVLNTVLAREPFTKIL
jgi:hypothetical protein